MATTGPKQQVISVVVLWRRKTGNRRRCHNQFTVGVTLGRPTLSKGHTPESGQTANWKLRKLSSGTKWVRGRDRCLRLSLRRAARSLTAAATLRLADLANPDY